MSTNLRIPDIKTYLYETTGKVIESAGFKFKKSNFSFKRKHGKDYESFYFLFLNYYPLNYRVHFLLDVWDDEIQGIKKKFPYQQNIDNLEFCTVLIPMGYFIDKDKIREQSIRLSKGYIYESASGEFIKNEPALKTNPLTWGQIAGYNYELTTGKDLFGAAEEMNKILEENVLPLAGQLSTIGGIDDFFAAHPGWSVNSLSLNNFASELIAAKLNGKRNLQEACLQIVQEIEKKILIGAMSQETKKVIEELYKYLLKG